MDSEKRSEIVEWIGTVRRCLLRYIPLVACRRGDVNDSILIYLLYLTKDLAKKKKITMVKPFAGPSGMDILYIAAPPWQPLRDGLAEDSYEGFYLIT